MFLYKLLLDIIYFTIIVPNWGYMGFTIDFSLSTYFVINFLTYIYIYMLKLVIQIRKKNFLTSRMIYILFMGSFLPNMSYISLNKVPVKYLILVLTYWVSFLLFLRYLPSFPIKIKTKFHSQILTIFKMLIIVLPIYLNIKYAGFRMNFSFLNVYDLRKESANYNYHIILKYFLSLSRIFIPGYALMAIKEKKYINFVFLFLIQILLFSIDGIKTTIMIFAVSIFLYSFNSIITSNDFVVKTTNIINLFLLASILLYKTKFKLLVDLFVRRIIYLPSLLSYQYFDFFQGKEKNWFRDGLIGRLGFTNVYGTTLPKLIGCQYFDCASANTGLFADAYANMGGVGTIIIPLFLSMLLLFIDSQVKEIPLELMFPFLVSFGMSLLSSSLFTVLGTHGILLSIVILILFNNKNEGGI